MLRLVRLGILTLVLALTGCQFGSSDSDQAKWRLLNASQDYDSLDLYVSGTREEAAIAYGSVSKYDGFDADTYTIEVAANNAAGKLRSFSKELSKKSHTTFVGYGRKGSFSTLEIDEDQSEPSSDETKLLVLNTATDAGAVDVYLTGESTDLNNASPVFSDVAVGSAASSGYVTVSSGTYRLRVTAAGSTTDIRLDRSSLILSSKQVVALVIADTKGGVLVNAMFLRQQDSLTMITNPNARIRAVVGVDGATGVTATAGGTTLLSNVQAKAIGTYQQVTAGTVAVDLTISGTAVSVANQSLTAGDDYTLLLWNDSAGTQTTLINDDNRRPADDSNTKIRLVNAMSGLGESISLSVDFSPVAEGIAVGQASSFDELSSTSDSELDVTNANTNATLYTKTSASLDAQGVYSVFMFGDASNVSGSLRKER